MAARPIFFDYRLCTADDCERRLVYKLQPDGGVVEVKDTGWGPAEPELQTTGATLEIERGPGTRLERLELDGDQHRDLESNGLFEQLLREIGAGRPPQEALAHTLDSLHDAPGPG